MKGESPSGASALCKAKGRNLNGSESVSLCSQVTAHAVAEHCTAARSFDGDDACGATYGYTVLHWVLGMFLCEPVSRFLNSVLVALKLHVVSGDIPNKW